MHRPVGKTAAVLICAGACTFAMAVSAHAEIAFAPCAGSNEFACGHLTVPLDPHTPSAGSVTLAIQRHRAPVGDEKTAVIALAGGPGQAALPFTEQFTSLLGPIISTRDLIVFDQRGTGLSHRLSCHRFEQSLTGARLGRAIAACAAQIGPMRSFYTTPYSAADIEAIRVAGGYDKLVLYGTSYGTKLAEEYAQAFPNRVEALVLDSVVPPNGPDPLNRATFAAVPRVLRQLCAHHSCARITADPTADLADLVAHLGNGVRHARWIDGHGHGHTIAISSEALIEALLVGDLEPGLRAEFPAAVRSAIHDDDAALARMLERARSSEGGESESSSASFDVPLFLATTCEETLFPWNRAAPPSGRLAEATATVRALGARGIAPFTRAGVLGLSDIPACAYWPFTTPAPTVQPAAIPSVPTLILSGANDLRTPTANAREVAAAIAGSKLLVVPNVGHSVLGDDPTHCSADALQALFAGKPIKPCPSAPAPLLLRPTPLPPVSLAGVAPARGSHGKPGRTLDAVLETLADSGRQLVLTAVSQLGSGATGASSSLDVGGLRSGWAGFVGGRLVLRGYSYVPGVTVSGEITPAKVELQVGGAAAAHGTLRAETESLGQRGRLSGTLGGQHVSVSSSGQSSSSGPATLARIRSAATAGAARAGRASASAATPPRAR